MVIRETAISLRERLAEMIKKHCPDHEVDVSSHVIACDRRHFFGGTMGVALKVTLPKSAPFGDELCRDGLWNDIEVHVIHRTFLEGAKNLAVEYEALTGVKCTIFKEC